MRCDNERHLVRCSIRELEQRIDGRFFLRLNRSAFVDFDRVAELRHTG
ncbi:LytTR family transcriptional regulator DNA-binding domain-containing protein [Verrucomicrobium spinosum]